MKIVSTIALTAALLVLLTWLSLRGTNSERCLSEQALQALDDFERSESAFHRDVLSARAGMLRNYDPLVQEMREMHQAIGGLRHASVRQAEMIAATEVLANILDQKEQLAEQFKTSNALLQNSLAHFDVLSSRLTSVEDGRPTIQQVSNLATAILHLTLDTSPRVAAEVDERLAGMSRNGARPEDAEAVNALLAHARMLRHVLPTTDRILTSLFSLTSAAQQDTLRSIATAHTEAAELRAMVFRYVLYGISLLLVGLLVSMAVRLQSRATALRRRAHIEHAIATISTRFICNSSDQELGNCVEGALEELATCIEADRAYFVKGSESPQSYRWSRDEIEFPADWPERARDLASRLDRGQDGVIHFPNISHLQDDYVSVVLADAGIRGWLCVCFQGKNGEGMLAFDALRPGPLTRWNEFGLFRMAFDAIDMAFDREVLSHEKARLEISLQQARRMETIGAITSGIAHNFNNIVGAILGYTEIAHNHVKSGSRPANSLNEIRRAGERARDLIDQILTFGRRSDARREPICLKGLLAETRSLLEASLPPNIGIVFQETPETTVVTAEAARLQQVFLNVCNNAAQAMDEGGTIEVAIDTRKARSRLQIGKTELGPGNYALISVIDTGRGMDDTTRERIFEPFFTTRREGNGLGLATVHEIVRDHGGAVAVTSAVGAGTRFDIWLPCAPRTDVSDWQPSIGPAGCGQGETILVLESDWERRLRHEEILAALGYEPVGFSRPDQGTLAVQARPNRFDAVLLCDGQGSRSALDVAAELHSLAPDLPIILETPSAQEFGALSLAAAGISELVHQSQTSAELAWALNRCLASMAAPARQERSRAMA